MKVAAVQMVSSADRYTNLIQAQYWIEQAAQQGAELVVLPEYFCLLGKKDTDKLLIKEDDGQGIIQQTLSQCAQKNSVWIVGGTMPVSIDSDDSHVFNTSFVWGPKGQCVARYDKIHLFGFDNGKERYDESRVLLRGHQPVTFDLPSIDGHTWRIGLSVCYDLRFPELYRVLSAQGADLFLVPSAFTYTTGQVHWAVLLRARAIENLSYVAAPAQGGAHDNGRTTWGHTSIVGPWGENLGELAVGAGIVLADCDVTHLKNIRQQLPALEHRHLS